MSNRSQRKNEALPLLEPATGKPLLEGSAAYTPFLQKRFFNTSTREVRQLWAQGFDAAVELFNKLIELDRRMKTKDQDDEYNDAVAKNKELVDRYKKLQEDAVKKLKALKSDQLKPKQDDSFAAITAELKNLIAETVALEAIRKQCEGGQQSAKQLLEQQQIESSTQKAHEESRLQDRDDVAYDPYVFNTQVEVAYGHPKAHPTVTHSSVEYAIESIFPALDEFLATQKEFLADQRPNFLSRFFRALPPFRWMSFFTDTVKFVEAHQKFVTQTEQKVKVEKQGLAGAAFNRLNSELISATFPQERFEKFAAFVKENGNFAVVNVPRGDIDALENFVQQEKIKNIENNKRGFFSRIWHGGQSAEYIERKNYLDNLTIQIATQRSDLRALQGENGDDSVQQKFQSLLNQYLISVFGADSDSGQPGIKGNYSALINNNLFMINAQGQPVKASVRDFSDFIAAQIYELEQNNQTLKQAWFSSFGESGRTIQTNAAEIAYLQKIKSGIDTTSADEFNAAQAIKLIVDTKSYSVKFLKAYNQNRIDRGESQLSSNNLMQLANEVITLSENAKRDFFAELLMLFNETLNSDQKILLTDINSEDFHEDQAARQAALLKLLDKKREFKVFVAEYKPNNKQDSDIIFFDYLKRFELELINPYRTLNDRTTTRISSSFACLTRILLFNGMNSNLLTIVSNYINMVRYGIAHEKIKITKLLPKGIIQQIKAGQMSLQTAKDNFLTALNLLQAIVDGKFTFAGVNEKYSLLDKTKPEITVMVQKLCAYVISENQLDQLGLENSSPVAYLIDKFSNHHLNRCLSVECKQRNNNHQQKAASYLDLIQIHNPSSNADKQHESIARTAYRFFDFLFCANANTSQDRVAIAKEINLDGVDKEIGTAHIPLTIKSIWKQQQSVRLDEKFNELKKDRVDTYVAKYDGKNTVYAEIISIVGTIEQIQCYAKKMLEAIFTTEKIELTSEQEKFILDNKDILEEIIHNILDRYTSNDKFAWNESTEKTLHLIGSLNNKQRYANKRIRELLAISTTEVVDEKARKYVAILEQSKINNNFIYPDFNREPSATVELVMLFQEYLATKKIGYTADFLADKLLRNQYPEILQQLRINQLDTYLTTPVGSETVLLNQVQQFIDYVKPTDGVLVNINFNQETLRENGKVEIDTIFSRFLTATNKKWFEFAECLACAFDEDKAHLQELRLRKIADLLDSFLLNDSAVELTKQQHPAEKYIEFVDGSEVKDLLCATDSTIQQQGKEKLNELFRLAICQQIDPLQDHVQYAWNSTIELLVQKWGTAEHKDLCAIAKLSNDCLIDSMDILAVEQYILQLKQIGFEQGKFVATEEGKRKIIALLENLMQAAWSPKVELLIEYFAPIENNKALLQEYRVKRFTEIMQNKNSAYGTADLDLNPDLMLENQLFKRREAERYETLCGRGGYATYEQAVNYFGLMGLKTVSSLLTVYVNSFEGKEKLNLEHYDINHFTLCKILLTRKIGGEELANKWRAVQDKHVNLKNIATAIKEYKALFLAESYTKVCAMHDEISGNVVADRDAGKTTAAAEILPGIEEFTLEFVKEKILSGDNLKLDEIKTEFVDRLKDGSFKKAALELIKMAKKIKDNYQYLNDQLNNFATNKMIEFSIENFEVLINSGGLNQLAKTLLLEKINQLLEEIKEQAFYGSPYDVLTALASSIKIGKVDQYFVGKLHLYSAQSLKVTELYLKIVQALDEMLSSKRFDLDIQAFGLVFTGLSGNEKKLVLQKIIELKESFTTGKLADFGNPLTLLKMLEGFINTGNITGDFQKTLQDYQTAYDQKTTDFHQGYTELNTELSKILTEKQDTFDFSIKKLVSLAQNLDPEQAVKLKEKFADAKVKAALEKKGISNELYAVLLTAIQARDFDDFNAKYAAKVLNDKFALYEKALKDYKPYAGFVKDCRFLLEKSKINIEENIRELNSLIAAFPKKPVSLFSSLTKDSQFSEVGIAVSYAVKQFMLKQLTIANMEDETQREKALFDLNSQLNKFVQDLLDKDNNKDYVFAFELVKRLLKVIPNLTLQRKFTEKFTKQSTTTTPTRLVATEHTQLTDDVTHTASSSSIKIEKASEVTKAKSVDTTLNLELVKQGSAETLFFGSPTIVSPPVATAKVNINKKLKADDIEEDTLVGAPPKQSRSIVADGLAEVSIVKKDSSRAVPEHKEISRHDFDVFDFELNDEDLDTAYKAAPSSSSSKPK